MYIDLSDFKDETVSSIHIEGKLEKDSLELYGRRIEFVEPIGYKGEIYKVDRDMLVHIDIGYKYREACGRCLESFIREDSTALSGKLVENIEKSLEDEEDIVIQYSNEQLDLTEDIISSIILSLPMKPLCSEECKGLCPKCGANHNNEKCDCVVEDIDPRLAILKDFFPKE